MCKVLERVLKVWPSFQRAYVTMEDGTIGERHWPRVWRTAPGQNRAGWGGRRRCMAGCLQWSE